jgi:hypothetical protein
LDQYCRDVEAYLCRKNDGHLVRIVGPAFERVSQWAASGVPLNAVWRGIDRTFERYYAKGPRRRPVRIEFCEADVLDVFDEWRRAVGMGRPQRQTRVPPLHDHLQRAVARLGDLALRETVPSAVIHILPAVIHELGEMTPSARRVRGDARRRIVKRLAELDRALVDAARRSSDPDALQSLSREGEAELSPFRGRLPDEAYTRSVELAMERLLRERLGLPDLRFD